MDPLLREKVDRLPRAPGVYVMRGEGGEPLYVGKAAALRARVRSYFAAGSSDARFFVPLLSGLVRDIETVVTATAAEALILENSLIKSLRPRYNVQLRDDKDYLSIRIDARAEWPRIDLVRRPRPDGARHFGPFGSARAARQAARAISRILRLRPCRDSAMRGRSRPCLQHQIGRCDAPCVGRADAEAYRAAVRRAVALLDGRVEAVLAEMRAEMAAASEEMRYERAADLRDQIAAIERTSLGQPQRVVEVSKADRDVVGIHREESIAAVVVLEVRAGKLVACRSLGLRGIAAPDDEVIGAFLAERYASGAAVPDEVIVPAPAPDSDVLEAFLSEARGKRVRVIAPRRGRRAALAEMARVNAEQRFVEETRDREGAAAEAAALARALRIPASPRLIECVDVSHWAGHAERGATVAAIAALRDGAPAGDRCRRFRVRRDPAGDDYAAMREVLRRRFVRTGAPRWSPPDLFVIDGGRGHLAVARTVLGDLGLGDLPVVAIAKGAMGEDGRRAPDRIHLAGRRNPVALPPGSPALRLLARVRDEAHRLAAGFQARVRSKRRLRDGLSGIPGVGPATRRRLLAAFGSVARIAAASLDDLRAVPGVRADQAAAVHAAVADRARAHPRCRDLFLSGVEPTPARVERTPGGGKPTPGGGERTPGGGEPTPGGGEPTPGGGEPTPGGGERTPGGGEPTPGRVERTPGGGEPTPARVERTPGRAPGFRPRRSRAAPLTARRHG